jgi:hypothetical protein
MLGEDVEEDEWMFVRISKSNCTSDSEEEDQMGSWIPDHEVYLHGCAVKVSKNPSRNLDSTKKVIIFTK